MKDYEIVVTFYNGCAGREMPMTSFDEATLNDPGDYIRSKHGPDFEKFQRQILPDGRILYTYENGVGYSYEFTQI